MGNVQTLSKLELDASATSLNRKYAGQSAKFILEGLIRRDFEGRIALVSAFGAESAVLLHLVAQVDPSTPVVFLETQKHFEETIIYRQELIQYLELQDVRVILPSPAHLLADDPNGTLCRTDQDRCCYIRKTIPMIRALADFSCWVNGRRREHSSSRKHLALFETQDRWLKVNPLVHWTSAEVESYFDCYQLPRHPLEAFGYRSIGCLPCTEPTTQAEQDSRAGRWAGTSKLECGIHLKIDRLEDPAPGTS